MSEQEKLVKNYLKRGKIVAVHLEGCLCVVCTYDYPNKEHIIELQHTHRSMPYGTVIPRSPDRGMMMPP